MPTFHHLPKTHKDLDTLCARPIVTGIGSLNEQIGQWLDGHMCGAAMGASFRPHSPICVVLFCKFHTIKQFFSEVWSTFNPHLIFSAMPRSWTESAPCDSECGIYYMCHLEWCLFFDHQPHCLSSLMSVLVGWADNHQASWSSHGR